MAAASADTTTTTTKLLHHHSHEHPLEPLDLNILHLSIPQSCKLCGRKISGDTFACGDCQFYCHRVCAEAPPQIDHHPLHPLHPLYLGHDQRWFCCDACGEYFSFENSSFRCEDCNFDLDLSCALSTLSDQGGSSQKTTPEQVNLMLHPHSLTSFTKRHNFIGGRYCALCQEYVEGDGYLCLRRACDFVIHKRCIQELYYADGSKAPQVYHGHLLETTILGEEAGSSRCTICRSNTSGEFIVCAQCEVFIHRDCIPTKDTLQYPPHPGHTLVLFINRHNLGLQCQSCSTSLEGELCYHCFSCEYLVHVECALQTLDYCAQGMRVEIQWTWHGHPLLLCHKKSLFDYCFFCENDLNGPTYKCEKCGILVHAQCTEQSSIEDHPYHQDHPILLHMEPEGHAPCCVACCRIIIGSYFSCELCAFYIHENCAKRTTTRKHYLHEHELLYLDEVPSMECNRCGTGTDSPTLRCVPCNFNLHEKCMELPLVVKHETHVHPLTLRESYVDDDSGEYYCDLCGKRRDGRLGVYVCEQCKVTWAFHIECVLPELRKVFAKKSRTRAADALVEQIARKNEEVRAAEAKLEEVKEELAELMKKQAQLICEEE